MKSSQKSWRRSLGKPGFAFCLRTFQPECSQAHTSSLNSETGSIQTIWLVENAWGSGDQQPFPFCWFSLRSLACLLWPPPCALRGADLIFSPPRNAPAGLEVGISYIQRGPHQDCCWAYQERAALFLLRFFNSIDSLSQSTPFLVSSFSIICT